MIGLGTWKASVSTLFFKGDVTFTIADQNGQYQISAKLPAPLDTATCTIKDIDEDGNTLRGKGEISALAGKEIQAEVTFDGDTMSGVMNVPFLGKVRLSNGVRVS